MANLVANLLDWLNLIRGATIEGTFEVRCPSQERGAPILGTEFYAMPEGVILALTKFDKREHAIPCVGMAMRGTAPRGRTSRELLTVSTLWADLDWKDYENGREDARDALNAYPLTPHCIVRSGGGYHAFWKLDRPYPVHADEAAERVRSRLRQLAQQLGADIAAAEVARILRAPGTLNRKYDPPIRSEIVVWNGDLPAYTLDEFPREVGHSPATSMAPSSFGDEVEAPSLDGLAVSSAIRALIEHGAPEGSDTSEMAQSVITSLLRCDLTPEQVRAVFLAHTDGIGATWARRGHDGDRWLGLSIHKALAYMADHRSGVVLSSTTPAPLTDMQKPEGLKSALTRRVVMPEMLIDGMLREGAIHALVSAGGIGKSWLSECLALHFATGFPLWGRAVKKMRVLVDQEEMGEQLTLERVRKLVLGEGIPSADLDAAVLDHLYQPALKLDNLGPLVRYVKEGRYDLVIIDSYSMVRGATSEVDNDAVTALLGNLKREICTPFGTQVLIIHHTRKRASNPAWTDVDPIRGAGSFRDVCDNVWILEKNPDDQWIKLRLDKTRGFEKPDAAYMLQVRNVGDGVQVALNVATSQGEPESARSAIRKFVLHAVAEQPVQAVSDTIARAADALGIPVSVAQFAFNELTAEEGCEWDVEGNVLKPASRLRVVGQ